MSLTKDDWAKMWEAARTIEVQVKFNPDITLGKRKIILSEVDFIKKQIQSVVGQME